MLKLTRAWGPRNGLWYLWYPSVCINASMVEWFVQSKKKEEWRKILYSTWFQVIFCKITITSITNLRVNQPCCLYAAQFPLLASNGLLHERLVTPPLHHHPYHCTACSWYSQVDCVRLHWYYKWCVSLHGYLGGQTFLRYEVYCR